MKSLCALLAALWRALFQKRRAAGLDSGPEEEPGEDNSPPRIDYSERQDSGKYRIRVNGDDAFSLDGVTAEKIAGRFYRITSKAEFTALTEAERVRLIELLDAETGQVVGHRLLPWPLNLFEGDTLSVTFEFSVIDNTNGTITIT